MKKSFYTTLLILSLIAVIASGCSFSTKPAEPTVPPAPTQPQQPPEQPQEPPAQPTAEPPAQPPAEPPAQPPAPTEAQPSGNDYFKDEPPSDQNGWTYKWVTGNTQDNALIEYQSDNVEVTIKAREESAVKFFKDGPVYEDVVVEGVFNNMGNIKNGFSLLCRVNEKGFYEFRISAGGLYAIYRFDNSLKEEGKNPYVFIGEGATADIIAGVDKTNKVKMVCAGKDFTYFINGKKLKTIIPATLREQYQKYPSGGVGFGVISYSDTASDTIIDVVSIETMAPGQ